MTSNSSKTLAWGASRLMAWISRRLFTCSMLKTHIHTASVRNKIMTTLSSPQSAKPLLSARLFTVATIIIVVATSRGRRRLYQQQQRQYNTTTVVLGFFFIYSRRTNHRLRCCFQCYISNDDEHDNFDDDKDHNDDINDSVLKDVRQSSTQHFAVGISISATDKPRF